MVIIIWYSIYCQGRKEKDIICSLYRNIERNILREIFAFSYERQRKYQGQWHVEILPMFPDYIFLESDEPEKLSKCLDAYRPFLKVLEDREMLLAVRPEEEAFLKRLCGSSHFLPESKGYVRDNVIHVTEGPLTGREQMIRKIDRHKRIARLEIKLFRRQTQITAGLEIISKE